MTYVSLGEPLGEEKARVLEAMLTSSTFNVDSLVRSTGVSTAIVRALLARLKPNLIDTDGGYELRDDARAELAESLTGAPTRRAHLGATEGLRQLAAVKLLLAAAIRCRQLEEQAHLRKQAALLVYAADSSLVREIGASLLEWAAQRITAAADSTARVGRSSPVPARPESIDTLTSKIYDDLRLGLQ